MNTQKTVFQFPKLTHVRVLDYDTGYFLQSVETSEILNIPFSIAAQINQYIQANYLIFVFEVLDWSETVEKPLSFSGQGVL